MAATVAIIYLAIIIFWMARTLNKYTASLPVLYILHLGTGHKVTARVGWR
jgi:uncharacterized membrane protein YqjE